jgi:UDP-N-acetylmuramyl pentapeptide phosphotransferase/UDP-N-acetylglucosamine-1-phosphate transferase
MPLQVILKYPLVFAAGLLAALAVTPLWCRLAPRLGLIDRPGGRKIHSSPRPVGGGVAVFIGFHAACAVVFLLPWQPFAGQISIEWWFRFIPLSIGVLALGLCDDGFGLKPLVKLSGQVALAVAAYLLNIRLQNVLGVNLPVWADFFGTVLWFLALMNSFNLIDGVDGLASGIALIAALGVGVSLLFRHLPGDVLLFLGLAGACLGFLRYNFYPATVFLGDTGSHFLGFTLAALAISTSSKGPAIAAIGMPMLAVGVPLFDSALAVWRRSMRRVLSSSGESKKRVAIDQADAEHLHHRLLGQGRRHDQVAWLLYAATALLALTGILTSVFNDKALGILGIAFVVTAYVVVRHLSWIELRDTGEVVMRGLTRPVRRNLSLLLYIVSDLLILNAAWLISTLLIELQSGPLDINLKSDWISAVPGDVLLPFLLLMAFRSCSRVWSLAGVVEFAALGMAGMLGGALSCGVGLLCLPADAAPWGVLAHKIMLFGLAVPCMVGTRGFFRIVQELMHRPGRTSPVDPKAHCRTLVAGNGHDLMFYLRRRISGESPAEDTVIAGIVSSDVALRGHYIAGFQVLGNPSDLSSVIRRKKINRLVWVGAMTEDDRTKLQCHLPDTGVRLAHWKVTEDDLNLSEL